MSEIRARFLAWTGCLLDASRSPGEHREAAHAWCAWAMARLGIDDDAIDAVDSPLMRPTSLATGQAISPQRAALCVREHRRTAVFLQGMAAALRAARERFPGETLHVVEAGCGPLAALTLPFAVRHESDDVRFTLLDLHPVSLAGARRLAEDLGAGASVCTLAGDATAVRFAADDRPHVIACEVLRRALKTEPQVAVTRALAPQLREGGFFLPERIDVEVGFLHGGRRLRRMQGLAEADEPEPVEIAGRAMGFDAYGADGLVLSPAGRIETGRVRVPPRGAAGPLHLFTRLRVFGEHVLGDFDCSLTMPERLRGAEELAAAGGEAVFAYEISGNPGLRMS